MKKVLQLASLVALYACLGWVAHGQTLSIAPSAISVPKGTYQTIKVTVSGVNNKTVTWTTSGGTLVGTTVCTDGSTAPCEIALYSATAGGPYTVTATSNADHTTTTTATVTFTASPTAATTHPRLYTAASNVAALQTKAAAGGDAYTAISTSATAQVTAGTIAAFTGTLTSGSPSITSVSSTAGLSGGIVIGGTGIPPQTTIVSIVGSTVTISNNATASGVQSLAATGSPALGADTGWSTSNGGGGYTCDGGTGIPSPAYVALDEAIAWGGSEPGAQAQWFALMSILDPVTGNRTRWKCRAHDVYLYYMSELMKTSCGAGICNANILAGNQGGDWGVGIGETPDILLSASGFSSGEITTIRTSLLKAAQIIATQTGITSTHPSPVGHINSADMLTDDGCSGSTGGPARGCVYGYLRTTGNNYFSTHLAQLTAIGAWIDAANDPTMTNCAGGRLTVCSDGSANSLQAYLNYAMGSYLYLAWLNYDDPAITTSAYNTQFSLGLSNPQSCYATNSGYPDYSGPTAPNCYGNARGGISDEGAPLYIGSQNRLRESCNMLQNAGLLDPQVYGPQVSFCTSAWWDETLDGWLHETTPVTYTSGSTYQPVFGYNEINAVYDQTEFVGQIFGNMLEFDNLTGRTDRSNALKWAFVNASRQYSYGTLVANNAWFGMDGFLYLPSGTLWSSVGAVTDPRISAFQPYYYSLNAGRLIAGTGWTSSGSVLSTLNAIYPTQDHEMTPAQRVDLYYKGDFVTKGVDGYCENDNTGNNSECLPDYSNTAAYFNATAAPPTGLVFTYPQWQRGGNTNHGLGTALNVERHSVMPTYTYEFIDDTGQRNLKYGSAIATDVTASSRDILWLSPHYLAIYDRGATGAASFKKDWFIATGTPTIVGHDVSWTCPLSGCKGYLHNLLPSGATVSNQAFEAFTANAILDYAPHTRILIDAGTPTSTQFLNVIEAQDFATSPVGASLNQSTAGQGFDCAFIAGETVMACFMRTVATFTGTTYAALGATTHYIANLTPNTTYSITGTGAPATATSDDAGVMTFAATGTGSIVVAPGGTPTVAQPTSSPTPGTYTTTQSVTLADATPSAAICFTTNGSTPGAAVAGTCDSSPTQTYSGAISVATTTTIKAIGTLAASLNSSVLTAVYTITPPAATPTFAPVAGSYVGTQSLTISTTTPSATIYYTTDGSTPTTGSTVYSGPISVAVSETVKAIATASGFSTSAVGSAAYVITPSGGSTTVKGSFVVTGGGTMQ